jgi:uncharacterized protein YjbJ (UPF0337 family)
MIFVAPTTAYAWFHRLKSVPHAVLRSRRLVFETYILSNIPSQNLGFLSGIHVALFSYKAGVRFALHYQQWEVKHMGIPNRDEVEGKFDQAKGKVKETVGRAVDDRDLEHEGQADNAGGKVQEGFGKARRKVGEAIEDVGDAIKR